MKHRVAELEGALLDAAVAMADGRFEPGGYCTWNIKSPDEFGWHPSTDWSTGGPIIEREQLNIGPDVRTINGKAAECWTVADYAGNGEQIGPTLLVAAMRAFVASKFGDEVELP